MITGVLLRYVMVPITDALDMDAISFFWVEETGEMLQTWLALDRRRGRRSRRRAFHRQFPDAQASRRARSRLYTSSTARSSRRSAALLAWQGWLITGC